MVDAQQIKMTSAHINDSIARALKGESYLDPEVLSVKGFSTPTIRHLLNQLCSIPGSTYLEVGAWFGGSACAAACNNKYLTSYVVENFAQDFSATGVRDALLHNLDISRTKTGRLEFIEKDCYDFDLALIDCPISTFFFDGEHSRESQAKALPHFFPVLRDRFLFMVDDTNWVSVAEGTVDGFNALDGRVRIEQKWVLQGQRMQDDKIWHNGVCLYLCSKIK